MIGAALAQQARKRASEQVKARIAELRAKPSLTMGDHIDYSMAEALEWALELIEAQEKAERVNREWLQQQYTEHVQLITTLGTQLEAAEERERWGRFVVPPEAVGGEQ